MIYGREQFGGFGEPAAVGAALLRLLPPTSGSVNDRRAEHVMSSTVTGISPFDEPAATQQDYLFDLNPLTTNAWWRSAANTTTQGFAATAGGTRPVECSAISADIIQLYSRQFPVPRFFISDTPTLNGSEVSLKVHRGLEANYGAQQRSNADVQYFCKTAASFPLGVGWINDYLDVPSSPSIARTSFTNLYSAGFPEVLGLKTEIVSHQFGTTNALLWNNGIEQRGFAEVYELQATLLVDLENPTFQAKIPLPGTARALRGNGTGSAERGAFYVVADGSVTSNELRLPRVSCHLYCSPYTGRGYIHVLLDEAIFLGSQYFNSGITFTFDHALQSRPSIPAGGTEIAYRYFAGVALTSLGVLPSVLTTYQASLNTDAIRMSVFTSPRVLESTAPPVLPSATGMVDAEQAMFLSWLGGPSNTLYLDGNAQQTPLADRLSLEPFGNQWATNVSGDGNTKRPNYIEDFQGATYCTGASRHNTLPSSSDWSGIELTIGQPDQGFWPVSKNNGVFRGKISTTALDFGLNADSTKMQPDAFAFLQCVNGTHQLTGYRGDGSYIGNNRYTSGNTRPDKVIEFDNTDETYGKPLNGGVFVPLAAGYQQPAGTFGFWSGSELFAYRLQLPHVLVGAPTSAVSVATLPRLSQGAPPTSSLTQDETFLGFLYIAGLSSFGLGGLPRADLAYDYDTVNQIHRYYQIPNAFPFDPNPHVGFLGGIGSRSTLTVTDFCAYVEILNEERADTFTEAIGRPLLTLRLIVGAHVRVDSVFASANVYEMAYDGATYVPGNIARTLDHSGLTSSTTNFTGFETFIELTRAESDTFTAGNAVSLNLVPTFVNNQTSGFERDANATQSDVSIPVTITPIPA